MPRNAQTIDLGAEREPWQAPNPAYIAPRLSPIDPLTLAGKPVPERRWIVAGWVPHGQTTMLNGDGGAGKSLLAMQLLTACATGGEWLGHQVHRCRALGVFCEDDADEIHRRQAAINAAAGIDFADLGDVAWISRVGADNYLMAEGARATLEPTTFFQQVHDAASDFGAQLLVLDSLHDLFGGNENNRIHARRFIGALTQLARDIDGAVVICAHPSAAGLATGSGTSGSTAWSNAVRSRLYLTRLPADGGDDTDRRILSRKKSNYAAAGDELRLRWTAGTFVNEARKGGIIGAIERHSAERAFLELLDDAERVGRPVSDSRNAGNYAPKRFAGHPGAQGFGITDFRAAMERLFAAGEIVMVDYGRSGDRRHKIVRKAPPEGQK